jgi:hypothetical protein
MFNDTCLVAHKRIDQSPRIIGLEIPRTAAAPKRDHLIVGTQSIKMQQTCIMNAWNERGSDSENFCARITEIGVTVEKI